eukprot:m.97516 g.97516  ORF g.97516 m.97516 type:complete len:2683 (+) comp13103_c0_seq2:554-8602(+)
MPGNASKYAPLYQTTTTVAATIQTSHRLDGHRQNRWWCVLGVTLIVSALVVPVAAQSCMYAHDGAPCRYSSCRVGECYFGRCFSTGVALDGELCIDQARTGACTSGSCGYLFDSEVDVSATFAATLLLPNGAESNRVSWTPRFDNHQAQVLQGNPGDHVSLDALADTSRASLLDEVVVEVHPQLPSDSSGDLVSSQDLSWQGNATVSIKDMSLVTGSTAFLVIQLIPQQDVATIYQLTSLHAGLRSDDLRICMSSQVVSSIESSHVDTHCAQDCKLIGATVQCVVPMAMNTLELVLTTITQASPQPSEWCLFESGAIINTTSRLDIIPLSPQCSRSDSTVSSLLNAIAAIAVTRAQAAKTNPVVSGQTPAIGVAVQLPELTHVQDLDIVYDTVVQTNLFSSHGSTTNTSQAQQVLITAFVNTELFSTTLTSASVRLVLTHSSAYAPIVGQQQFCFNASAIVNANGYRVVYDSDQTVSSCVTAATIVFDNLLAASQSQVPSVSLVGYLHTLSQQTTSATAQQLSNPLALAVTATLVQAAGVTGSVLASLSWYQRQIPFTVQNTSSTTFPFAATAYSQLTTSSIPFSGIAYFGSLLAFPTADEVKAQRQQYSSRLGVIILFGSGQGATGTTATQSAVNSVVDSPQCLLLDPRLSLDGAHATDVNSAVLYSVSLLTGEPIVVSVKWTGHFLFPDNATLTLDSSCIAKCGVQLCQLPWVDVGDDVPATSGDGSGGHAPPPTLNPDILYNRTATCHTQYLAPSACVSPLLLHPAFEGNVTLSATLTIGTVVTQTISILQPKRVDISSKETTLTRVHVPEHLLCDTVGCASNASQFFERTRIVATASFLLPSGVLQTVPMAHKLSPQLATTSPEVAAMHGTWFRPIVVGSSAVTVAVENWDSSTASVLSTPALKAMLDQGMFEQAGVCNAQQRLPAYYCRGVLINPSQSIQIVSLISEEDTTTLYGIQPIALLRQPSMPLHGTLTRVSLGVQGKSFENLPVGETVLLFFQVTTSNGLQFPLATSDVGEPFIEAHQTTLRHLTPISHHVWTLRVEPAELIDVFESLFVTFPLLGSSTGPTHTVTSTQAAATSSPPSTFASTRTGRASVEVDAFFNLRIWLRALVLPNTWSDVLISPHADTVMVDAQDGLLVAVLVVISGDAIAPHLQSSVPFVQPTLFGACADFARTTPSATGFTLVVNGCDAVPSTLQIHVQVNGLSRSTELHVRALPLVSPLTFISRSVDELLGDPLVSTRGTGDATTSLETVSVPRVAETGTFLPVFVQCVLDGRAISFGTDNVFDLRVVSADGAFAHGITVSNETSTSSFWYRVALAEENVKSMLSLGEAAVAASITVECLPHFGQRAVPLTIVFGGVAPTTLSSTHVTCPTSAIPSRKRAVIAPCNVTTTFSNGATLVSVPTTTAVSELPTVLALAVGGDPAVLPVTADTTGTFTGALTVRQATQTIIGSALTVSGSIPGVLDPNAVTIPGRLAVSVSADAYPQAAWVAFDPEAHAGGTHAIEPFCLCAQTQISKFTLCCIEDRDVSWLPTGDLAFALSPAQTAKTMAVSITLPQAMRRPTVFELVVTVPDEHLELLHVTNLATRGATFSEIDSFLATINDPTVLLPTVSAVTCDAQIVGGRFSSCAGTRAVKVTGVVYPRTNMTVTSDKETLLLVALAVKGKDAELGSSDIRTVMLPATITLNNNTQMNPAHIAIQGVDSTVAGTGTSQLSTALEVVLFESIPASFSQLTRTRRSTGQLVGNARPMLRADFVNSRTTQHKRRATGQGVESLLSDVTQFPQFLCPSDPTADGEVSLDDLAAFVSIVETYELSANPQIEPIDSGATALSMALYDQDSNDKLDIADVQLFLYSMFSSLPSVTSTDVIAVPKSIPVGATTASREVVVMAVVPVRTDIASSSTFHEPVLLNVALQGASDSVTLNALAVPSRHAMNIASSLEDPSQATVCSPTLHGVLCGSVAVDDDVVAITDTAANQPTCSQPLFRPVVFTARLQLKAPSQDELDRLSIRVESVVQDGNLVEASHVFPQPLSLAPVEGATSTLSIVLNGSSTQVPLGNVQFPGLSLALAPTNTLHLLASLIPDTATAVPVTNTTYLGTVNAFPNTLGLAANSISPLDTALLSNVLESAGPSPIRILTFSFALPKQQPAPSSLMATTTILSLGNACNTSHTKRIDAKVEYNYENRTLEYLETYEINGVARSHVTLRAHVDGQHAAVLWTHVSIAVHVDGAMSLWLDGSVVARGKSLTPRLCARPHIPRVLTLGAATQRVVSFASTITVASLQIYDGYGTLSDLTSMFTGTNTSNLPAITGTLKLATATPCSDNQVVMLPIAISTMLGVSPSAVRITFANCTAPFELTFDVYAAALEPTHGRILSLDSKACVLASDSITIQCPTSTMTMTTTSSKELTENPVTTASTGTSTSGVAVWVIVVIIACLLLLIILFCCCCFSGACVFGTESKQRIKPIQDQRISPTIAMDGGRDWQRSTRDPGTPHSTDPLYDRVFTPQRQSRTPPSPMTQKQMSHYARPPANAVSPYDTPQPLHPSRHTVVYTEPSTGNFMGVTYMDSLEHRMQGQQPDENPPPSPRDPLYASIRSTTGLLPPLRSSRGGQVVPYPHRLEPITPLSAHYPTARGSVLSSLPSNRQSLALSSSIPLYPTSPRAWSSSQRSRTSDVMSIHESHV